MLRSFLLAMILLLSLTTIQLAAQEQFLGKTVDGWVSQLKNSANVKDRRNAAFALGKMGQSARAVLSDMKAAVNQEKDGTVREVLVFALGNLCRENRALSNDRELEDLLLTALKDEEPLVRRSAAYAIGCLQSKSVAVRTALGTALDDPSSVVRQNAAWALGKIGAALGSHEGVIVVPSLARALRDPDSLVKRDAASALALIENPARLRELVPDLLPLCADKNSEVRRAALNLLVGLINKSHQSALPALLSALKDPDLENRRNAAMAVSNIGSPQTVAAVPVLLEAVRNGDARVRPQAVLALRNIGPGAAPAVKDLIGWLRDDKDEVIRRYAAMSLGSIGKASEPAIPVLLEKLAEPTESLETRRAYLSALAEMGAVPSSDLLAAPLLRILDNPREPNVIRQFASWAMRVHLGNRLADTKEAFEIYSNVIKERPIQPGFHIHLLYECAYTLGFTWQDRSPEATYEILLIYLRDEKVLFVQKSESGVGGVGLESKGGAAVIKERISGDARMNAVEALERIGAAQYGKRAEIMQELRKLADNPAVFAPLGQHAKKLVNAVENK